MSIFQLPNEDGFTRLVWEKIQELEKRKADREEDERYQTGLETVLIDGLPNMLLARGEEINVRP